MLHYEVVTSYLYIAWISKPSLGGVVDSACWFMLWVNLVNCSWQVLVVRQDLKMKSGKIASQCARKIFISFVFCFVNYLFVYTLPSPALLLPLVLYLWFTFADLMIICLYISSTNMQMLRLACMQSLCKGDCHCFLVFVNWNPPKLYYFASLAELTFSLFLSQFSSASFWLDNLIVALKNGKYI